MAVFIGLTVETQVRGKSYKVFEAIGHGHVSSNVCLSLRNAFHMRSFQAEIKHKKKWWAYMPEKPIWFYL